MQLDLFCPIFGRESVYTRLCNELLGRSYALQSAAFGAKYGGGRDTAYTKN